MIHYSEKLLKEEYDQLIKDMNLFRRENISNPKLKKLEGEKFYERSRSLLSRFISSRAYFYDLSIRALNGDKEAIRKIRELEGAL